MNGFNDSLHSVETGDDAVTEKGSPQIDQEEYNYKNDPQNPLNWPRGKKLACLTMVSLDSFVGYFTSAIYLPAVPDIVKQFKTNLTVINATIALYLFVNAVAPLIYAPLSERIGRRWIYIVSLVLFSACSIVCGFSTNIGMFFVFRLLQAFFACAGQAVGGGSVSDIFEVQDRSKAMGIYMFGTILGPAIAPVIGGYIDQYLGWRWIFYIKAILGAVFAILNFFLVPETFYVPEHKREPAPTNIKERLNRLKFNPFSTLRLLLQPDIFLACLPVSVAFGGFYYLITILSVTFNSTYGFSTGSIGLCYLASGIGNTMGALIAGFATDKLNSWLAARNNNVPLKEHRLILMYIGMPFFVAGTVMYGWFIHAHIQFMGALVAFTIMTFGLMLTITCCNTYLVDCNLSRAASVISINNFTRCVCGMTFSLTAIKIRGSMGDGWSYTFIAILTFLSYMICIPIVQRYAVQWREKREQMTQIF